MRNGNKSKQSSTLLCILIYLRYYRNRFSYLSSVFSPSPSPYSEIMELIELKKREIVDIEILKDSFRFNDNEYNIQYILEYRKVGKDKSKKIVINARLLRFDSHAMAHAIHYAIHNDMQYLIEKLKLYGSFERGVEYMKTSLKKIEENMNIFWVIDNIVTGEYCIPVVCTKEFIKSEIKVRANNILNEIRNGRRNWFSGELIK